jgi:transglutaminase-like putative cysteine protease
VAGVEDTGLMVRRARVIAPLALAALSVVAALSLGRVVDSSRFVLPVVGAALLPHALGAVVRWRGWSVWIGWALAVLGLVVYVLVALETSTLGSGFPADTWHAIETQLSGGWHLLRTAPAPAPTTDGAILLAVLAVWFMAALADWLAFGRQTALAAVSPALVFFVWTSTLGTDDQQLLLTVGFCVATGAFVLAQNLALLDQRRSWLVSQRGARPHWLAPAAVLGGAAIVVALVVAPLVPGSSSDPLLDVAGTGRNGSGGRSYKPVLAPFIDISEKLKQVDNVELFTVKSEIPDYWRIAALDKYSGEDGGSWTLSAEGDDSVGVGLPSKAPAGTVVQHFDIGQLGERWLPAAYDPKAINLPDTLVVKASGTIVADADSVSGLQYDVASKLAPLSAAGIGKPEQDATAATPPADVAQFIDYPKTAETAEIGAKANDIIARTGATTPFDKAAALRDFFRSGEFTYDTQVDDNDDPSAILAFLRDKRGFCVQFASTYALMVRTLGIPARVAVGFTPGKTAGDDTYRVSSHDAHAWPEIYLSGLGWTHMFDPTPDSRTQPSNVPGGSALPSEADPANATVTTQPATASTVPATGPGSTPANTGPGAVPDTTPVTPTLAPTPTSSSGTGAWLPVLVVVGIIALVLLAYMGAVLGLKRRRRTRRHRADDPVVAVGGAWAEALDRLHEADVTPRAAQTPFDLAASVPVGTTPGTAEPMQELARVYGAARYGDGSIAPDDARDAWASLDELERALDDGVSFTRRWRRRLDASTLVRR